MKIRWSRAWALLACVALAPSGLTTTIREQTGANADIVVLLHGLARSAESMSAVQDALLAAGYSVCNIDYPSRDFTIEALVADHVVPAVRRCAGQSTRPLHFVTHSMGGILVRQIEATTRDIAIGRVVMLGPPNGGSEVVDKLSRFKLFKAINGPAGLQLGTDETSLPRALGSTRAEVGIVAGDRTINPVLSLLIPGDDDGKVSLGNAKLDGMSDYVVVSASHPFLMTNADALSQATHFLRTGGFAHTAQ